MMTIFFFKNTYNHMIANPPPSSAIHKLLFGLLPSRVVIAATLRPSLALIRFLGTTFFALLCIASQAFLAPPAYADHDARTAGICTRTAAVHREIVANIPGVTDCAMVTTEQLAAISFLDLGSAGITALKAGDFAGLSALTRLHLRDNQLGTLPDNIFSDLSALITLNLNFNRISTLPNNVFSGLGALRSLLLSGNRISTLPTGIFSGLSMLTELILGNNQIITLPNNTFSGLTKLTELSLHSNQISTLSDNIFSGLSALTGLSLSSNQIITLPDNIFSDLSALITLDLDSNQIITLPAGIFSGLSMLTELILGNNQIVTLPDNTFSGLSSLTRLGLYKNQINELPAGIFSGLTELTELYLFGNQIITLPTGIFSGLSALTSLRLGRNPLDTLAATLLAGLPATIAISTNIAPTANAGADAAVAEGVGVIVTLDGSASFDLEKETLTYTWTQIAGTPMVTLSGASTVNPTFTAPVPLAVNAMLVFSLVVNDGNMDSPADTVTITSAAAGICSRTAAVRHAIVSSIGATNCAMVTTEQLAALSFLNLGSAGITALKAGDFADLSTLTRLRLSLNRISTLPAGIFSGLSSLTTLDLDSNRISTLPAGIFSGLSSLTVLDLHSNRISTLPAGIFSGLSALTVLDLDSNQISTLPATLFTGIPAGADIKLDSTTTVLPVADAGLAQTVTPGQTVTLNGSAAVYPRAVTPTYLWTQTLSTPMVTLSDANTANPTFTAPDQITADAVLTFSLMVNDGTTNSSADTVIITVSVLPIVTLMLTPDSISEGGAVSTITATLSDASSQAITLAVTATPAVGTAADAFMLSTNTTLTIVAGATTSTGAVTLTSVDNNIANANRMVTVSATTTGGSGAVAADTPTDKTLTITDDDIVNAAVLASSAADADATAKLHTLTEAAISAEHIKQLNTAIMPKLTQAMLGTTLTSISSRLDSAFSGATQSSRGQLDGVSLGAQSIVLASFLQKLPGYVDSLKEGNTNWRRMLANSSFTLSPQDAQSGSAKGLTVWGISDYYGNMEGKDDRLNWDGEVFTVQLGIDKQLSHNLLVGGLVSWSDGNADADLTGIERSGYNHQMISVHPYLAWSGRHAQLWGSLGYGQGKLKTGLGNNNPSLDTRLVSMVAGGEGHLAHRLSLKSDIALTQTDIDGSSLSTQQDTNSQRLRLLLKADLISRGHYAVALEAGARYDHGDGDSGLGAVLDASMAYNNPAKGLIMKAQLHTLLGKDDYSEWGLSALLELTTKANGRGLAFSLSPSYSLATQDSQAIWQENQLDSANNLYAADQQMQLETRLSYGLLAFATQGLLTPYSEVTFGDTNSYRLGIHWQGNNRLDLDLFGEHRESHSHHSRQMADQAIMLKGKFHF